MIDNVHGAGIDLGSDNSAVVGCYIGTDVSGANAEPDTDGVRVVGSGDTIGGTSAAAGNVISGNLGIGVVIVSGSCLVEGNLIGTNAADTAGVANGSDGIVVIGPSATIGGTTSAAENIISGNGGDGIHIEGTSCLVEGNLIGKSLAQRPSLANTGDGIQVDAAGATIGGTSATANIICGNGSSGVDIEASCLVAGNLIGFAGIGNSVDGIYVGAAGATIGGTAAPARNFISGNSSEGIDIEAPCLVEGNEIGLGLTGTSAVANGADGILVGSSGATIGGPTPGAGNVISGNSDLGIDIGASCLVQGNLVGTNAGGNAAVANGASGILVRSSGATIGGSTSGAGNVVSGNSDDGIVIDASCLVQGNLVGTNAGGDAAVANGRVGIGGSAFGVTIGGTSPGARNVISGNDSAGIALAGANLVEGNWIGTNEAGTAGLANAGDGIDVPAAPIDAGGPGAGAGASATVGGTSAAAANIISGNSGNGIDIMGPCLVEGNLIGTNAADTAGVANGSDGILVSFTGVTIGGTASGAGNFISGNGGDGIHIEGTSCLVEGNLIGKSLASAPSLANTGDGIQVDAAGATIGGTSATANIICGNGSSGVDIEASCLVAGNLIGFAGIGNSVDGIYVGAAGATIGGSTALARNFISGNSSDGIDVEAACLVEGNAIGLGLTGTSAVANAQDGIYVGSPGATIGGASSGAGNLISGNDEFGVDVGAPCLVEGNVIGLGLTGTSAVANAQDGIYVGAAGATIGGASSGAGNVISGNDEFGVDLGCAMPGRRQPGRHQFGRQCRAR